MSDFSVMLNTVKAETGSTAQEIASGIGYSPQYVGDLLSGNRKPSVEVVKAICKWLGRGPKGCLEWHRAGARAHGWEV